MILKGDPTKRHHRKQRRAENIVRYVETAKLYQKPTKTRIKISHNKHTGRRLPIHCTSYAALFFILTITGLLTLFISQQSVDAGPTVTDSSSVNVSGVVPTDPPTTPALITGPANGTNFSSGIINVSGSCASGFLVEIYRDNAFAGSQICDTNGQFLIKITIVNGKNTLIAKISDSLGQYGPNSEEIIVYLTGISMQSNGTMTDSPAISSNNALPLLIFTRPAQRGSAPNQLIQLKYEIEGGTAPYALSIDWGDGSDSVIEPHKKRGDYDANYIYQKPGQYTIKLLATDSAKNKAFTQTILIVNGAPEPLSTNVFNFASAICAEQQGLSGIGAVKGNYPMAGFAFAILDIFGDNQLLACKIIQNSNIIWPVFVVATTMTFSFWLGERIILHRYKDILKAS